MVLCRKKLKQKLRYLMSAGDDEGVVEAEGEVEVEAEAQSIKERLVSSRRPRPKRSKKPPPQEPPAQEDAGAAIRRAEEEWRKEVERSREGKRKEKKEKRRIRRAMEKEAAAKKQEAEAEAKNQELEVADAAVGSNDPVVAGDCEQNIKKVFVGGIPYYSSEDDIRSFFEGCGSIIALDCMTFPESGKFRGIAILTFKTEAAAQRALALDGADMGGFYLKIQPYKSNREKEDFAPKMIEGYNRIYVGNLPWDITEDDLEKFFSDCKISSIRFGTDKERGDFKGYAHVDFSDGTSLAVALKLDQKVIKGRPVRIRCAVPKKDNQKPNDANSDSSKNKIRACYECGTPGHLSSSCPNKKASEVISDEKKADVDLTTALSKKRRTCYECGIPGHLSSACPNKKAAEVVSNNREPDDDVQSAPSVISEEKKIGDESNSAASKKRQKCYECGISGHLSSACPNKKATQVISGEEKPGGDSNTIPSTISDGSKTNEDSNTVPSKKKKRRTCYECGIAGHLSSECPNKTASAIK